MRVKRTREVIAVVYSILVITAAAWYWFIQALGVRDTLQMLYG